MPSYSSIFVYSVLALGASAQIDYGYAASAQNDYGYAAPSAQEADSYSAVSASTSTPHTSCTITSTVTSTYSSTTAATTSQPSSQASSSSSSKTTSQTSSEAAQVTAAAAAAVCPITFEKGCAFLCSGPKIAPSCETEWYFSQESSCTPCPGIPEKCPSTPEPSCAFLCKAQGAAASKGDAETPFCWASDVSKEGEIACSPCGSSYSVHSHNTTAVSPTPASNVTFSTHDHGNGTATISTHHHKNATTYAPPPIYTSGASAMKIGASAVVGLALVFFAL
ncbi:hypothetical protein TWF481_005942 [Arthrobotrys musiformis]|uniref:Uncharacterized protein n=1 Tax=Arthrobotrys musiformis TaxID=47236 RepID=A0AAV9WG78_9PEZI